MNTTPSNLKNVAAYLKRHNKSPAIVDKNKRHIAKISSGMALSKVPLMERTAEVCMAAMR